VFNFGVWLVGRLLVVVVACVGVLCMWECPSADLHKQR